MKIAVLTILNVDNYGAELQAHATVRALRSLGHDAEILNYLFYKDPHFINTRSSAPLMHFPPQKAVRERLYRLWSTAAWLSRGVSKSGLRKRIAEFHEKNTPISREYRSIDELYGAQLDYDAFAIGSDQVWNPGIYSNIKPYLLDFAPTGRRLFSYASSFGVSDVPLELQPFYAAAFQRFDRLSVREQAGAELVKRLSGREAMVVLDPTLLLTSEQWREVAAEPDTKLPKHYILAYTVSPDRRVWESARNLGRQLSLPVIGVDVSSGWFKKSGVTELLPGPDGFLALFDHAECVLTNSFHGTAFSINFRKPFYSFINPVKLNNSRQLELLEAMGVKDRVVVEPIVGFSPVDFSWADSILEQRRDASFNYLYEALQ